MDLISKENLIVELGKGDPISNVDLIGEFGRVDPISKVNWIGELGRVDLISKVQLIGDLGKVDLISKVDLDTQVVDTSQLGWIWTPKLCLLSVSWAGRGHQSSTCYQSAKLDLGTQAFGSEF